MARNSGDSVAEDRNQGWGEIHRRLEAQDDARREWLDKYVRRLCCKVCGIKLTDYWQTIHPNRCPRHKAAK